MPPVIALVELAFLAVEDPLGQTMAFFWQVAQALDVAP
jgi:hypothetical protein